MAEPVRRGKNIQVPDALPIPLPFPAPRRRPSKVPVPSTKKRCPQCGITKPVGEFYKSRHNSGGLKSWCKVCTSIDRRNKYKRDDGVSQIRAQNWKRYGLTPEDYMRMLAKQGGLCAICRDEPPTGKMLVVDHCHATGAVRGLLCRGCNTALGGGKDKPEIFLAMIEYLRRHQRPAA